MHCGNNKWSLLGKRAVVFKHSIQIESRDNGNVLEIIIRIIRAATGNLSVDEAAPALADAVEDVIYQRITIYTFLNVMVFSITLVQSYSDASPRSWEDKAVWITEQVSSVKAAAYQRYHIDDWIQEQSGWTGVLRLVREHAVPNLHRLYAAGAKGFMRRRQAVAGMICIITTVAAIWHNW